MSMEEGISHMPLKGDKERESNFLREHCPDYIQENNPYFKLTFASMLFREDHILGLSVNEFTKRVVAQSDVGFYEKIQDKILGNRLTDKVSTLKRSMIHHLWMGVVYHAAQKGLISQNPISREFADVIFRGMRTPRKEKYGISGLPVSAEGMLAPLALQTMLLQKEGKHAEALDWIDMAFAYSQKTNAYGPEKDKQWNAVFLTYKSFAENPELDKQFRAVVEKHFKTEGLDAIDLLKNMKKTFPQTLAKFGGEVPKSPQRQQ